MDDEVHLFTFHHRVKCKLGGQCTDTNREYLNNFRHPEFYDDKSDCMDVSTEHLHADRHLPLCPDGIACLQYQKKHAEHLQSFRHCRAICTNDNCYPKFHNEGHVRNAIHSFQQSCPFTPYNCSYFVKYSQATGGVLADVKSHCLTYSHVCQYGRLCRTKEDGHYGTSIHIAPKVCPHNEKCPRKTDESHLESFSHTSIRDIRLLCRNPGYKYSNKFEDKHLKTYRHARDFNYLGVAPYKDLNAFNDFFQNQGKMIKTVNNYVETSDWEKTKVSEDILNWIRALQSVHRCRPKIFESILVHGYVMSRDYMSEFAKSRCLVNAIMQHSQICSIFFQDNASSVKEDVHDLVKLLG